MRVPSGRPVFRLLGWVVVPPVQALTENDRRAFRRRPPERRRLRIA